MGDTLPDPISCSSVRLNAATVGIIALTAVNFVGRAIIDTLTRILILFAGGLGMLYTALWYYPVIMSAAALKTLIWDMRWLTLFFTALDVFKEIRHQEGSTGTRHGDGSSPQCPYICEPNSKAFFLCRN
ncbi:MAG: hypothetical protein Q9222_007819 [Ikaeria aurantiellina]